MYMLIQIQILRGPFVLHIWHCCWLKIPDLCQSLPRPPLPYSFTMNSVFEKMCKDVGVSGDVQKWLVAQDIVSAEKFAALSAKEENIKEDIIAPLLTSIT
jgi:hypothetical protein